MKIPLKQYWNLLVNYLRPQWVQVLLLSVLLLGGIGLQLINPQIMRRFIDAATQAGVTPEKTAYLRNMALLFIGFALVQQIVTVIATYLSAYVGWTATNALRAKIGRPYYRTVKCIQRSANALLKKSFAGRFVRVQAEQDANGHVILRWWAARATRTCCAAREKACRLLPPLSAQASPQT